jgi:hypothetical protein
MRHCNPFHTPYQKMAKRVQTRKAGKKGRKGTRKLSPALKQWNEKVMKLYREMKRKDPKVRLGDAMKAAKRA